MPRRTTLLLVLLCCGCARPPVPDPEPAAPAPPAPKDKPPKNESAPPLLAPEALTPVAVSPRDASLPVPRYQYPESYQPLHDGKSPKPEPIPALPARKPSRVLGDLRFYCPAGFGAAAVSRDGGLLAVGGQGVVYLFDAATGRERGRLHGQGAVDRAAFAPDGKTLYTGGGSSPGWLHVWDVPGRRELFRLQAEEWALTPDGNTLVTVESVVVPPGPGEPNLLLRTRPVCRVLDTRTWKDIAGYAVSGLRPSALAVSPDGRHLAFGGDNQVRVWDRTAGKELPPLTGLVGKLPWAKPGDRPPPVTQLAFSPDGKTLAAVAGGGTFYLSDTIRQVVLWDWPAGTEARRLDHGGRDVILLAFSPDGRHLLTGDGVRAAVWDAATGALRGEREQHKHGWSFAAAAFTPDGRRLYAPYRNGRPELFTVPDLSEVALDPPLDLKPPKLPFETDGPSPPHDDREGRNAEVRRPDGSTLRSGPIFDGGVRLLDPSGKEVRHFEKGRVVVFDVTPDGKLLAAYGHNADGQGFDYPLRLWEVATGREAAALRVYPRPDYAMRFSPDGTRLAVRHADGLIRVWDVKTLKPLLALEPDGHWARHMTFSKDGRFLVGGTAESPVAVVWDLADDLK